MADYRLFRTTPSGSIIGEPVEFEHETDDAAIAATFELHTGERLELWSRARLVKVFPARTLFRPQA